MREMSGDPSSSSSLATKKSIGLGLYSWTTSARTFVSLEGLIKSDTYRFIWGTHWGTSD